MASILKVNTIQDATNSNTAISVDTTGRVTTPATPSFYVVKNSTQTAGSSDEQVTWDTVQLDVGSNFASNVFTVPVTGVYFISCMWLSAADTAQTDVGIRVNSTNIIHTRNAASGGHETTTANLIRSLTASDTVQVRIMSNGGKVYGDTSTYKWSTFMGYLIG